MAQKRGYFADAGLPVRVLSPIVPNRPAYYVATGIDDIALAPLPQAVIAREMGIPIVVVGSVISQPTAAMIWLKGSKIRTLADLKGKTIAVPGVPFQEKLLQELLARAGLTPEEVTVAPVGYRLVPALLKGEADAIFGGSPNIEGKTLESRGAQPVIKRVQDLGIPTYDELVVIARVKCVAKYPQVARRFMKAIVRGAQAAVRNPRGAARVIEQDGESNPASSRREIEAQVEATLPLLSRSGHLDLGKAARYLAWMHDEGLIQRAPPLSGFLTNDYLVSP